MRVVITLNPHHPRGERGRPSTIVVALESEHTECQPPESATQAPLDGMVPAEDAFAAGGATVSILLGGPHDEQVRRGIPEGEHILEDPAFEPIGFYGLAGIDRGRGAVVQFYRWIDNGSNL